MAGADRGKVKSLRQYKLDVNGRSIPLIGNVDIAHQRLSLVHSMIPEFHYPRLFELLSEHGVYIDSTFTDVSTATLATAIDKDGPSNLETRLAKFEAYKHVIKNYDMETVETVEA